MHVLMSISTHEIEDNRIAYCAGYSLHNAPIKGSTMATQTRSCEMRAPIVKNRAAFGCTHLIGALTQQIDNLLTIDNY
jgi:hypothetical protein